MGEKTRTGLLAGGIVAGLLCVGGLVALFATLAGGGADAPRGERPAAARAAGDPWPECAAVRAWLRDNLNDPASLEIVAWEARERLKNGVMSVRLKYRARNDRGAAQLETKVFDLRDGKVWSTRPGAPR